MRSKQQVMITNIACLGLLFAVCLHGQNSLKDYKITSKAASHNRFYGASPLNFSQKRTLRFPFIFETKDGDTAKATLECTLQELRLSALLIPLWPVMFSTCKKYYRAFIVGSDLSLAHARNGIKLGPGIFADNISGLGALSAIIALNSVQAKYKHKADLLDPNNLGLLFCESLFENSEIEKLRNILHNGFLKRKSGLSDGIEYIRQNIGDDVVDHILEPMIANQQNRNYIIETTPETFTKFVMPVRYADRRDEQNHETAKAIGQEILNEHKEDRMQYAKIANTIDGINLGIGVAAALAGLGLHVVKIPDHGWLIIISPHLGYSTTGGIVTDGRLRLLGTPKFKKKNKH